jgi:hypothetical protein
MLNQKRANKWGERTDWQEVRRRAGGRRRFNAARQLQAEQRRRAELAALIRAGRSGLERGVQRTLAQVFAVHPSTVSRDIRAILGDVRAGRGGLRQLLLSLATEQVARGQACPCCRRAFP